MPLAISGTSISKSLADERGVRAAHDDLGALVGLAHLDDVDLDARAVVVALEGDLLGLGQQRLDACRGRAACSGCRSAGRARDDVALAIGELLVHLAALDVADELHEDLLGGLGGDAPEVLGRRVPLARDVALDVELEAPDLDLAGLGVDLDLGVLGRVGTTLVGGEQRVGQRDEELALVDVLVTRDLSQRLEEVEVRHGQPFVLVARTARARATAWLRRPTRRPCARARRGRARRRRGPAPCRRASTLASSAPTTGPSRRRVGLALAALAQRHESRRRRPGEVLGRAQLALEAGARDVEREAARDRVVLVEPRRQRGLAVVRASRSTPPGRVTVTLSEPGDQLDVVEVEPELGQEGAEGGLELHCLSSLRGRSDKRRARARGPRVNESKRPWRTVWSIVAAENPGHNRDTYSIGPLSGPRERLTPSGDGVGPEALEVARSPRRGRPGSRRGPRSSPRRGDPAGPPRRRRRSGAGGAPAWPRAARPRPRARRRGAGGCPGTA